MRSSAIFGERDLFDALVGNTTVKCTVDDQRKSRRSCARIKNDPVLLIADDIIVDGDLEDVTGREASRRSLVDSVLEDVSRGAGSIKIDREVDVVIVLAAVAVA